MKSIFAQLLVAALVAIFAYPRYPHLSALNKRHRAEVVYVRIAPIFAAKRRVVECMRMCCHERVDARCVFGPCDQPRRRSYGAGPQDGWATTIGSARAIALSRSI